MVDLHASTCPTLRVTDFLKYQLPMLSNMLEASSLRCIYRLCFPLLVNVFGLLDCKAYMVLFGT